jgi:2-polyprenyl-6-methoxyphenol hydroxylase-like FAD-dependent oxidoreductase
MSDIQSKKTQSRLGKHAVVIGGSIAGLLTARVLSDYFDTVTIFDSDTPPEQVGPRKGVPQGNHIHTLMPGGTSVIRKYFPKIHDDLIAAGAEYGDPMLDWRVYFGGRWTPRVASGLESYLMSRPLLEAMVRKHTLAIENVELRVATPVDGLVSNESKTTVIGVTLRKTGETIDADFVADVSGRGSQSSTWLEQLGFAAPASVMIGVDVGYVTFLVEEPAGYQRDWSMIYTTQDIPNSTRGGGILCIEEGRWMVTAQGYHKDHAPTDWLGFLAYLKDHRFPDIYETVKDLQPLGEAKKYGYATYLRRRYEALQKFPEQYVVLGDAICSLNPIYGQGMTVASKEAEYLDACLRKCVENGSMDGFALPFFKGAAKFVDAAWDAITVEDFRYPQTRGKRPMGYRLAKWLNGKFMDLSGYDKPFAVAFFKVISLVEPPKSILTFKYLLKAAFAKKIVCNQSPAANIPVTGDSKGAGEA